ncbi:MAG: Ig-like domain-containing protein [Anaerolineae bacterium]
MTRNRFWTLPLVIILLLGVVLSCAPPFLRRATPTPTAPPLPATHPLLLVRSPARGEETPLDRPLRLVFDQPMDRASVQAAFRIEPKVEGTFSWPDPVTLVFTPRGQWQRATRYRVKLEPTAQSAAGVPLKEEVEFTFATVGYLEVSQVIPEPGARDVPPTTPVTIMFNRPVVPLQLVSAPVADMPVPVVFDPPVEGAGEWVNTSIYVFRPKTGFVPGQTYRATVPAGLSDTTGGVLEEDFSWEFTIEAPYVLSVEPATGSTLVPLTQPITVTFSQPMDRASTQAAFALKPVRSETRVPGRFEWSQNDTVMTFIPEGRLELDTEYLITLEQSARSAQGAAPLKAPYRYSFRTVPYPRILFTEPRDGAKDAYPGTQFTIKFSAPMDLATLMPNITIIPEPTRVYTYWDSWENSFVLNWEPAASTSWEVRLGGRMADPYGNTIGQDTVVRFTTRPLDPAVYLQVPGNIGLYNAYTSTYVYASYLNVSQIDVSLSRLTWEQFQRLTTGDWWAAWEGFRPPEEQIIRRWTIPVEAPLNEARYQRIDLAEDKGPLPPGLYLLDVSSPETRRRGWPPTRHILVVSRIHMTLKLASREALVWATDLSTGKPVPNLPVTVSGKGGTITARGTTDADGVFRTGFPPLEDLWTTFLAYSGAPGEPNFSVVHIDWYSGIGPWDFNFSSEFYVRPYRIHVYTDRPIYRPGQPVYFRGVVRAEDDARYTLPPAGETVSVTVRDDQGKEIYQETLPLSDLGTFHGQFTLAREAGLGYYFLEVNYRKQTDGVGFQVAMYRRPEFQVTVTPDKDQVLAGDKINVTVQATYFFGGPVAGAKVRWTLMTQDTWFRPDVPGWWDWTDTSRWDWWGPQEVPGYGRVVADGTGTTDDQGRFVFTVPADIGDALLSQQFTLEATVTDVTDQSVSNRAQVLVHKGLFYIGLRVQRYVGVEGEEQPVEIRTVDWEGEPVARVPLTVTLNRREWLNVQEEDEYGNRYWTWTVSDTVVATTTVTTDDQGEATVSFVPPSGGSYIIKAEGTDEKGNRVVSATWLWVSGREYVSWRQENNDRIYLIADQREYRPGETAKILIPSPFQGRVTALFTVERGHIIRHWVQTLEGNAETVDLPITAEMAPNAFVSVVLVKGMDETNPVPAYRLGYVSFAVSTEKQELTVRITPDRDITKGEHYGPRETVHLNIEVTDSEGKPVEAEVGLAVVDKSVLTLAPPNAPSIVEGFYGRRGLGVRTADNLSVSVDRISVRIAKEAKGGGGGAEMAVMGAEFIRQEFPDTAFWAPSVRTDARGQATLSFQLPDQLTTWHIEARAVAQADNLLVGQAELEILSTKDLLVRPVTPRFFVVGDRADLAAVVHNNSDRALEVEVSLEAPGLRMLGQPRQTVTIPAKGKVRVEWPVEVPRDFVGDRADLVFRAQGGGLSDATKPPAGLPPDQYLPVYRYSAVEVVGTAGQLAEAGSVLEAVVIPPAIDTTQGDLTVKLEPSLAAGMTGGLKYLEHFPYECTEQLVSKFLPNVLTYRALKELGLARPELEAKLRELVSGAIQKLYQRQHPDGGWGWWTNDPSNPLTTAYVVFGLVKAKEAGFAVEEKVIRDGVNYLRLQIKPVDELQRPQDANRQAFILYVLAEAGQVREADLANLYEVRGRLSYYGRAYLGLALGILNPEDPRIGTIIADLTSAAVMSGTGIRWQEAEPEPWNWNTDTRTTALVLALLARFDPKNSLAPGTVRWLMRARTADRWETTQETAWALIALTDWLVATRELEGNYGWGVRVNGRDLGSGRVTPETVQEVTELRVAIKDLFVDQANRVEIARGEGPGRLYYTVHLRGYLPVEEVQALNRGVIVGRVYERADCRGEPGTRPCPPVTEARVGDLLRVRLTIIAPTDLNYVVVEEPFPAGTDPVDTSLLTTSVVGERPELVRTDWDRRWGWGWWWFVDTDLRDEKLVLFATELPRGTYEYTYLLQVGLAGEYKVLPTTAYEMYFPEVMGRTDGVVFTVRR